jgi:hypothetical protein
MSKLFCSILLLLTATFMGTGASGLDSLAPFLDEREALEAGEKLGIGSALLEGPTEVEVYTFQSFKLTYMAGESGIAPGGGIRVAFRHVHNWSNPQLVDPKAEGFLTIAAPALPSVSVTVEGARFFTEMFPWQHVVEVKIPERGLSVGETIDVTYGDRSGGSPGIRVQPFDETRFVFKVYVDPTGGGTYLPLKESPSVAVIPAEPHRFSLVAPSQIIAGEPSWCILRAEDRFGNPTPRYTGNAALRWNSAEGERIATHRFTASDRGLYRFENLTVPEETDSVGGVWVAGDGTFSATSNPVILTQTRPEDLLLWGDLHGHTLFSDGRGTVEEFYDFAENVAGLDFCAVTDHAFQVVDWMWEHSKKVTNQVYKPGRFVTFQAFEWSGIFEVGGDHNVFFLQDNPPIYRSRSYYDYRNQQMYHGPEPQANHIEDVYNKLIQLEEEGEVFCIPHWGGRHGNPVFHNPRVQRMIEVFSEHRRSEDWMTPFLTNGHRLGIIASTDGHYGNPGYGYLRPTGDWSTQEIGMAAVACHAPARTREAIFKALYDRNVYATSGDRIVIDMDWDGHPMGAEYRSEKAPTLTAKVIGTAPVGLIQIKKNSETVHSFEPNSTQVEWTWTDSDFDSSVPGYYYVRVLQTNSEEAITSPVWVDPPDSAE